ncbi:hypothetical protein [Actinospica robiniae]|uniref:hypothetical protein n=1 Tax=Actinospica robiniae TaxID=304901 RepID=UPI000401394E|nr:hypothetical protein [Actinospica robiniae]
MNRPLDHADPLMPVLADAQYLGNPVLGADPQHWPEIIRCVRRRWGSFQHRHPAPAPDTRAARVEDLARGLLVRCTAIGRGLIEISDCRALARRLALVLEPLPEVLGADPTATEASR